MLMSYQCMFVLRYFVHSIHNIHTTVALYHQRVASSVIPDELHLSRYNKNLHMVHGLRWL
jgi:hypothetical protein